MGMRALKALMTVFFVLATVVVMAQPASASPPPWWDVNYTHRLGVTIMAADALQSGYSIQVSLDHQAAVNAGISLASGNDVRIARWNGSSWDELDRVLAVGSSWNSTTTKIYFKTQAPINASTTDTSYYLYYGNASAGAPPADGNNVYYIYDDFNSGPLDTAKWYIDNSSGTYTVDVNNGHLRIANNSAPVWSRGGIGANGFNLGPPGTVVESTITMPSQSFNLWNYSNITPGKPNMGLRSFSPGTREVIGAWPDYADIGDSTMTAQTWTTGIRTKHVYKVNGDIEYYEDGALLASQHPQDQNEDINWDYSPAWDAEAFEMDVDDIVVRYQVDNQPSVILEQSADVTITAVIDPALTFTVAGRASVCNGQAGANFQTGATATTVAMGHLNGATVGGGAQDLNVITNAANGFSVYLRTSGTTPNSFRDGTGHSVADVSGTNASPGAAPIAGTEGFGYTTSDASTAFTSNTWAKLTNTNESVLIASAGTQNKSACVGYELAVSGSSPAGSYSTTAVYTAVPNF